MRSLERVPGSVLWLLVPQAEIQAALHAHAAARLIFAPFVTPSEHLARLPTRSSRCIWPPCRAISRVRAHLEDKRLELPLFDNERFAGEIGALFARMVGRWRDGLPPAPLPAPLPAA